MPTISIFLGITISMFYEDHNPAHFHAKYQEFRGQFTLDGDMINGDIPKKQQKFIAAWAELHKDELLNNWELIKANKDIVSIDPLR